MIDLNRLKDQFYIQKDRFKSIYIEIAIVDSILMVEIRIVVNRRSNSDRDFDSTTTIRFRLPNRISL